VRTGTEHVGGPDERITRVEEADQAGDGEQHAEDRPHPAERAPVADARITFWTPAKRNMPPTMFPIAVIDAEVNWRTTREATIQMTAVTCHSDHSAAASRMTSLPSAN
jgi:hypothetical protein